VSHIPIYFFDLRIEVYYPLARTEEFDEEFEQHLGIQWRVAQGYCEERKITAILHYIGVPWP